MACSPVSLVLVRCVCRNEIASCEEAAYDSLPLKDAATLLFFKSQNELLTFAQQVYLSPILTKLNAALTQPEFYREDGR